VRGTRVFEGDGTRNEQYFGFGAKVSSVANGKVVFVRDGLPEQTPGGDLLDPEGPLDFGGNQVVVRMGRSVYAQYYHLQPGSIEVRKGERVKTGQLLGKLGNTGNSFSPHLHFELTTGPNVFTSDSLPYVFDRYRWAGEADLEKSTATDLFIRGNPHEERKSHPLFPSLADFQ
jgi:murein DD-endopeptidase MepM/ murein hydrolase activator NlpD